VSQDHEARCIFELRAFDMDMELLLAASTYRVHGQTDGIALHGMVQQCGDIASIGPTCCAPGGTVRVTILEAPTVCAGNRIDRLLPAVS
jgi:hypothetical protein